MCYPADATRARALIAVTTTAVKAMADVVLTIKDPVILLNAKDMAQLVKLHYSRSMLPEHTQEALHDLLNPGPYTALKLYEHRLGRDLDLLSTPFPVGEHLVERSVWEEHMARKQKLIEKGEIERALSKRMAEAFKGQPVTEISKLVAMKTMEKALAELDKKIFKARFKVEATMDGDVMNAKIEIPSYMGVYAAGAWCGVCGKRTHECSCIQLDLELEETPRLHEPVTLDYPKIPPAGKTYTPAEIVGMKTTDMPDRSYAATPAPECYLCARKPATLRLRDGGVPLCRQCALVHLTPP